jgi:tol-pal system protein YbgF
MTLPRIVLVFLAAAPMTFGASKEIQELQRDVAILQDQLRNMQKDFGDRLVTMQTLVQTTLDGVNRTNNLVNVMENKFSDAMKQQQQSVSGPVLSVTQKLDQMSEDFRAVRESVLDMNTRMGKLDAKFADLQNLINTLRTPPPPPPGSDGVNTQPQQAQAGPPAGLSAESLYTNAYRDYLGGKQDLALQEFTEYLKYFPTTQFASNAQYYIGDVYYQRHDYTNALQAFDAVMERFPDGNKTPDAYYMKGLSFLGMNKNDAAAAEFRDLIKRYPDSDLAAKAKARLKEMGLNVGATSSTRRKAR